MKKIISIALALVLMVSCFVISSVSAAETYTYEVYELTTSSSPMNYKFESGYPTITNRATYNGHSRVMQFTSTYSYSITFSVDNLPAGEYDVSFAHISQTTQYRGIFDVYVNGVYSQTVDFSGTANEKVNVTLDSKAVSNGTDANTVTFTGAKIEGRENQMFLQSFSFVPTGEAGETVATTSATTTTTTTTTTQASGEEKDFFVPADVSNMNNWVEGWWSDIDGAYEFKYPHSNSRPRAALAKKVKVTEGETYKFSISGTDASGLNIVLRIYDASGTLKGKGTLDKWEYTIPSGIKYVSLTMYDKDNLIDYIKAGTVSASMAGAEDVGETTDLISIIDGASIRLNEVNGMRFYATLTGEATDFDEMGFIIAPKDVVEGQYFTMDDDHIKVNYDHWNYELWEGNQFVGSIVNVNDNNLARDFIARAYVVIDGETYYSKNTTIRNLASIADEYIADANGGYSNLDAVTKDLVDTWASTND